MTGMAADNRRSYTDRVAGRHPGLCFWSSQNVVQSMMKGETGMVISREESHLKRRRLPGERRRFHNITNKERNATKKGKFEEIRFGRTKSKPQ
ncbi:hypothetical protein DEO72_LG9g993 [Vigna unguiculata]|uniref:Uncharacterized protein n=1 Tax=Vigna unguiculata TaxID=3917 RepID=A0A4D6MZ83_VIGUN|nr:hypothetical protein DEO72_LG5g1481 [Vigna unguiculata]QCE05984.1 hypothetical protein DEO72_LG9g993 [Vigna unguiculata]